jgi:hypothetical protein
MNFLREGSAALVLATLTLSLQGRSDCLGRAQFCVRRSQIRGDPLRHGHDAIDDCVHRFARIGDSALGCVLSLVLFSIMGICFLLLDKQLCHRWLWRYRSPADVADLGSSGKHHRRADLWLVGGLSVRHREQASRP